MGHRGGDGRFANAVRVPRFPPSLEGGIRRRQTYLRRHALRMVQRSHGMLSGIGPPGAGSGHRLDGAPALRRGAAGVFDDRRSRRRHRSHQQRLRSSRCVRRRRRARAFRRQSRPSTAPRRGLCMRIAHVAPVATSIPPPRSGSVETMTSLLTEGLVARGHDVTLFATGDSKTQANLCAIYPHGYWHDQNMWPWELYEMLNLAAAVERAADFDIIHYEAAYYPMSLAFTRLCPTPIVQTLHHSPSEPEVALWTRYPDAPFVAISEEQAGLLRGLHVV